MSVGASSIKRAAKSAGKAEETKVEVAAKETTAAAPKKKPGRPAKKQAQPVEKPVKAASGKKPKKSEEKSANSLKMYGIGDTLPIHLM